MKLVLKDQTEFEISTAIRDVFKRSGDGPYLIYITLENPKISADEVRSKLTEENLSEITITSPTGSMKRFGCELNDLNEHLSDTIYNININLTAGQA